MEEESELRNKTIAWAGVMKDPQSGESELVLRFTDGTRARVGASAREGYLVEMHVHVEKDHSP